uniref:Uncharacterized protein n=1 Tax=Panagrolaimus superbus TaxID=310955 RepID=A0A914Z5U5_9BILA
MESTRNLILQVQVGSYLAVFGIDSQTCKKTKHEFIYTNFLKEPDTVKLFENIGNIVSFKQVKAILLDCKEFSSFEIAYKFRQEFYEFCKKHGIFYLYIPSSIVFEAFAAIFHTKTMVKEGEEVLVIFNFIPMFPDGLSFIREKNGYRKLDGHKSTRQMLTQPWKREFMGNCKPQKVVVLQLWDTDADGFKKCFKEYHPIVITQDDDCSINHVGVVAKALHYMDEYPNEYDTVLQSEVNMHVCVGYKNIIKVTKETVLPFKESVIVEVNPTKTISLHVTRDVPQSEIIQRIKMSDFTSQKVKISFAIDINSFYDFKAEPYDKTNDDGPAEIPPAAETKNERISESKKSDIKTSKERVRIVFSKQSFSVFGFENGKESFMEADIPIYIAFTAKKPIIGKDAMDVYGKKKEFVVFDIIKLCSTMNADIMSPKWGFLISKKDEIMMVTVETAEGERQSSVDFLLSLILNHGIKVFTGKKNDGKKIEELEIEFNGISANQTLKQTFEKAAENLNLKIVFC